MDDDVSSIAATHIVLSCLAACAGFLAGVIFRGMWS